MVKNNCMFKQWCRYRRYNNKMQRKSICTLHCTTTIFQISAMTISIPILIKLVVSYSMNQTMEFTDLALMTISYINIEIDDIDHNYQSYRYVVSWMYLTSLIIMKHRKSYTMLINFVFYFHGIHVISEFLL